MRAHSVVLENAKMACRLTEPPAGPDQGTLDFNLLGFIAGAS